MRTVALLLSLTAAAAYADEVDLSHGHRGDKPPTFVVRAEGGNEFAPFGFAGGALSWLSDSGFELEAGAGGGFPGLQLGIAARHLFGEGASFLVTEIALAGNTRVQRGGSPDRFLNPAGGSNLWTDLGVGFEQRNELLDLSVVGCLVFTTQSLTPQWAIHGGVGFGF